MTKTPEQRVVERHSKADRRPFVHPSGVPTCSAQCASYAATLAKCTITGGRALLGSPCVPTVEAMAESLAGEFEA